jgi:TolB-like protein
LSPSPSRRGLFLSTRLLRPKGPPPAVQAAPAKLIAVLPFDDISPDKSNAYFSAGLADEIIADLSRIGSLRVFSRTSAMVLKSTLKDVQAMGREHGIDYVLEGSVRKAERDIRLTVQLTDTATGTQLWGDQYGGTMDDIFEIQERLARSVVDALQLKLTAAGRPGSLRPWRTSRPTISTSRPGRKSGAGTRKV